MLSHQEANIIIRQAKISVGPDDPRSSIEIALTLMEAGTPKITKRAIGATATQTSGIIELANQVPSEAVEDAILYFSNS